MLSKTGLQALLALIELAKLPEGRSAGAAGIARKIKAPPNYLGKILQKLAREGLVVSQKGFRGGFRLARDPSKISLYDVVDPTDGIGEWSGCLLGRKKCSDRTACVVHERWGKIRGAYIDFLKRTSLKDLVNSSRKTTSSGRWQTARKYDAPP